MGFLDRAKKLAEQAKDKAEQARDMAQQAIADAQARQAASGNNQSAGTPASPPSSASAGSAPAAPKTPGVPGTPYVPGMLGRPGWREKGLTDPAGLLEVGLRDRAGVPRSTKSQILEEPYGMGRRWSSGPRSAAVFYQLYPEHQSWQPPGGFAPVAGSGGGTSPLSTAALPDGRSLVHIASQPPVVIELQGIDDATRDNMATEVALNLEVEV